MADEEIERLKNRVRAGMIELGTDATGLSKMFGRGKDYVRDFLGGRKRTIDAQFLESMDREIKRRATPRAPVLPMVMDEPQLFGERDFPVYAAAEGGPGEMVVSTEPIELVARPWFMREVRDGFAILIVGDSMDPVYEAGDIAIVNPKLPPQRGKDAIFTTARYGGPRNGEFKATIKRLIRPDANFWHVRQFNEPKEFALDKLEWPSALRVVGKLNG